MDNKIRQMIYFNAFHKGRKYGLFVLTKLLKMWVDLINCKIQLRAFLVNLDNKHQKAIF